MKASQLKSISLPDADLDGEELVWLNVLEAPFKLHGVMYDSEQGMLVRMKQSVADAVGTDVKWLNRQSAGGRVSFRTDSDIIAMYAVLHDDDGEHHTSDHETFDLLRSTPSLPKITYEYSFEAPNMIRRGFAQKYYTGGTAVDWLLQLPVSASVYELYIGLRPDAELVEASIYRDAPPVVFYGSSITQGARASRPSNTYQSMLSKSLRFDYTSLGFAGNARGEREIAEYIATLDMSAFVLDYDHNAPNAEHLLKTHEPFFKVIRERHPTLPIIIMSAPNTMPWYDWHIARRDACRATWEHAVAAGDKNVYFVDGSEFFGEEDRDLCTVDTCHPNDLGMYRMAKRLEGLFTSVLSI